MKCYLDVFFEISSLRRIVEVQNVIVGAVLRQKKNFEVICGALAQFKVKLTGAMILALTKSVY